MRNILKFLSILFLGVISCACMNTVAVHELNQKAAEYLEAGDVNSAISRLEASIDLDGNVYESRYNLAVAYMQKNECQKALDNILVASKLVKDDPAVYYTLGVSSICVADKIFTIKKEDGTIEDVKFDTSLKYENAVNEYVNILKQANESFKIYTQLAPTAEDSQEIISLIRENEAKIENRLKSLEIK